MSAVETNTDFTDLRAAELTATINPTIAVGEWQTVTWTSGGLTEGTAGFISNHPKPEVLYLAGLNKKRPEIESTVNAFGNLGVRVVGVELPFPDDMPKTIEDTMTYGPTAVVAHIRGGDIGRKLMLIGESLGGGIGLVNADRNPNQYATIALWNPLGPTNETLHHDPRHRPKVLLRRLAKHALSQGEASLPTRSELQSLLQQLEYATAQDGVAVLQRVATRHEVAVFSGGEDTVFRTREFYKTLSGAGLSRLVRRVDGGHSSRKQMVKIARWLRSRQTTEQAS